jgi:hypothetical protein
MHTRETDTPKWLKRTQEGSWEPEILISGIILLALTQVPRLIDKLHFYLEERTASFWFYTRIADDFVFTLLKTSSYWLIAALIVHLVMRSVWVSFIGLSYVYPQGINHDRIRLSPYFKNKISTLSDFTSSIIRLEKICSSIYATAFLLVMVTLSACLYGVFLIFLGWMLDALLPFLNTGGRTIDTILQWFTLLVAMPYFIDFLTLGLLKRIKWLAPVYKHVYNFMSAITLAPVYRGIYYGLLSNLRWYYLAVGVVVFVGLTFSSLLQLTSKQHPDGSALFNRDMGLFAIDGYYRDQQPSRYSTWAHIQSATVQDGVLELFVVHKVQYERLILEYCDANRALKGDEEPMEPSAAYHHACLCAFYSLQVDGVPVSPTSCVQRALNHTGQLGLFMWVDVAHMARGAHRLEVFINRATSEETTHRSQLVAHIPFYTTQSPAEAELPHAAADSTSLPGIQSGE